MPSALVSFIFCAIAVNSLLPAGTIALYATLRPVFLNDATALFTEFVLAELSKPRTAIRFAPSFLKKFELSVV